MPNKLTQRRHSLDNRPPQQNTPILPNKIAHGNKIRHSFRSSQNIYLPPRHTSPSRNENSQVKKSSINTYQKLSGEFNYSAGDERDYEEDPTTMESSSSTRLNEGTTTANSIVCDKLKNALRSENLKKSKSNFTEEQITYVEQHKDTVLQNLLNTSTFLSANERDIDNKIKTNLGSKLSSVLQNMMPKQKSNKKKATEEAVYGTSSKELHPPLKNAEYATILDTKLTGYMLNPEHDRGKHKARVFERIGFNQTNACELKQQIMGNLSTHPALPGIEDKYGKRFTVMIPIRGPKGRAVVETAWIYKAESPNTPTFITGFIVADTITTWENNQ